MRGIWERYFHRSALLIMWTQRNKWDSHWGDGKSRGFKARQGRQKSQKGTKCPKVAGRPLCFLFSAIYFSEINLLKHLEIGSSLRLVNLRFVNISVKLLCCLRCSFGCDGISYWCCWMSNLLLFWFVVLFGQECGCDQWFNFICIKLRRGVLGGASQSPANTLLLLTCMLCLRA